MPNQCRNHLNLQAGAWPVIYYSSFELALGRSNCCRFALGTMVAEDWDGTERLTQCRIRQGSCYLKRNYPQFLEKSRTGFVKYFSSLRVSRVSRPGFFELRDLWSRPKIRRNVLERRTKWRRVRRAPPINAKAGSIGSIGSGRGTGLTDMASTLAPF